MKDVTSSMINVFRALLGDGEVERVGELMKALEGRPESEIEPLWDFYTGHWVDWFLREYEKQLTRAQHPLQLVAIDRPGGYCVELYESRYASDKKYKLNTVAQIGVHSEDAAVRLQTALHARLEAMAPSAFIVPDIAPKESWWCPHCGGELRHCNNEPFCMHCDECGEVTTHYDLMMRRQNADNTSPTR